MRSAKSVPLSDDDSCLITHDASHDDAEVKEVYVALWTKSGHVEVYVTPDEADLMALALMAKATEARS